MQVRIPTPHSPQSLALSASISTHPPCTHQPLFRPAVSAGHLYKALPSSLLNLSSVPSTPAPSTSSIPAFLTELLPTSSLTSYSSKLHNKHLQLTASLPTPSPAPSLTAGPLPNRPARRPPAPRRPQPLSSAQRKRLRLFSLPSESSSQPLRYASFLPLHALWVGYMREVVGAASSLPLDQRLMKADYHGALLEVLRSERVETVGVKGLVLMETQETWKVLTEEGGGRLRTLAKRGSVFGVKGLEGAADGVRLDVELYGSQMCFRSAERAARKWKGKPSIQLQP